MGLEGYVVLSFEIDPTIGGVGYSPLKVGLNGLSTIPKKIPFAEQLQFGPTWIELSIEN